MIQYLSLEDILYVHFRAVRDYGGSHGVRDEGRIASVAAAPQQQSMGRDLYESLHEKAAVYLRNIISDHPFVDGNKRTAVTCAIIFLMRNGVRMTCTPRELEDFAVSCAVERLDVEAISRWLTSHSA